MAIKDKLEEVSFNLGDWDPFPRWLCDPQNSQDFEENGFKQIFQLLDLPFEDHEKFVHLTDESDGLGCSLNDVWKLITFKGTKVGQRKHHLVYLFRRKKYILSYYDGGVCVISTKIDI